MFKVKYECCKNLSLSAILPKKVKLIVERVKKIQNI